MIKVTRKNVIYEMSASNRPAAVVDCGETVVFETYDCYQGQLLPEGTTLKDMDRRFSNPATGPVYVNGAMPGDLLKITITKLDLGPIGILDIGPNSGALKEYFSEAIINRIRVTENTLDYDGRLELPTKPMIGVIGNAPAQGAVSTMTPMDHGGNMDCTMVAEGAILYLPVFVQGALLALGDFHAIMGDGEVANCGLEIEGEATLKLDVIRDMPVMFPLVENETHWIVIASAETLDQASEKATKQLFAFLTQCQNLSKADAGVLINMLGNLIVCQIVNPMKTVRMEIPKRAIAQLKNMS